MLTAVISALGVLIGSIGGVTLKYYFDNRKLKNEAFSKITSQIISEEILEPFHFSIELSLYKLIIPENKEQARDNQIQINHILYSLKQLQKRINANSLISSLMTDYFLSNLYSTIKAMESENIKMRQVNKAFQFFSGSYFDLLNKVRKSNFLPPRRDRYRTTFHLYKQKNARKFERNQTRVKATTFTLLYFAITIFSMILIVSTMQFMISFYHLILYLYNTTN